MVDIAVIHLKKMKKKRYQKNSDNEKGVVEPTPFSHGKIAMKLQILSLFLSEKNFYL